MGDLAEMTTSAHDVADEVRKRLPGVGVLKLHKLLYYAQGWHLVQWGEPLFGEAIEAWANGPVVASLWADEKHNRGRPAPSELSGEVIATIEYVIERYGHLSGKELIDQTHAEAPWREVAESDDPSIAADPRITDDALRCWFEQDPERVAHVAAVERLRARRDIYSFEPRSMTQGEKAAVERALRGERVVQWPS